MGTQERRGIASCASCLSWGGTFARGLCLACYNFRPGRYGHYLGACGACGRELSLKQGYCRLCWCQAKLLRETSANDARGAIVLAPYLPHVIFQQLFLTFGNARHRPAERRERRRGIPGRPPKPAPAPADLPRPARWHQEALFDPGHLARTRVLRRFDLRTGPAPDNPYLAWALHVAHTTAEARGWSPVARMAMQRTLVPLLADYTGTDPLYASEVHALARGNCIGVGLVLDVLAGAGIVVDDRPPTFACHLERALTPLPAVIARDVRAFAYAMIEGTARTRPRSEETVRQYLLTMLPPLQRMAVERHHLREVTTADVRASLTPLTGRALAYTLSALRALFAWAKRTGVIFRNPMLAIRAPERTRPLFLPMPDDVLVGLIERIAAPDVRLAAALAAIHGATHDQIRRIQLTDLDLAAGRITIGALARPLDPLTLQLIQAWLRRRAERWPGTANPHLLITKESAIRHGQISRVHLAVPLRPLGITLEKLRIERRLEEAIHTEGDALQIAELFGIDPSTAIRYAASARALLAPNPGHDPAPADSPASPASREPAEREPASSSS